MEKDLSDIASNKVIAIVMIISGLIMFNITDWVYYYISTLLAFGGIFKAVFNLGTIGRIIVLAFFYIIFTITKEIIEEGLAKGEEYLAVSNSPLYRARAYNIIMTIKTIFDVLNGISVIYILCENFKNFGFGFKLLIGLEGNLGLYAFCLLLEGIAYSVAPPLSKFDESFNTNSTFTKYKTKVGKLKYCYSADHKGKEKTVNDNARDESANNNIKEV